MLHRRQFFQARRISGCEIKDIAWFLPDGHEMTYEDWQGAPARSVCVWPAMPSKKKITKGRPIHGDTLLLLFNAHHKLLSFTLPGINGRSDGNGFSTRAMWKQRRIISSCAAARRITSTLGRSPC